MTPDVPPVAAVRIDLIERIAHSRRVPSGQSPGYCSWLDDVRNARNLAGQAGGRLGLLGIGDGAVEPGDAVLIFDADAVIAQLTAFLQDAADPLSHRFIGGVWADVPAAGSELPAPTRRERRFCALIIPPKTRIELRSMEQGAWS